MASSSFASTDANLLPSDSCPRPPLPSPSPPWFPPLSPASSSLEAPHAGTVSGTDSSPISPPQSGSDTEGLPSSSAAVLPISPISPSRAGSTIIQIEQIIEAVMDDLRRGKELSIPFSRRSSSARARRPGHAGAPTGVVSFPGKTEAETKLFTQVLSILQMSHQALLAGTFVTKRNIFYQHRDLFRDQRVVDGLVDDIAYTLGIGRDCLHIVAASVGVVCGQLSFVTNDGERCFASGQENGLVIPPLRDIRELDLSSCQWILVIEKDATFRTLAASGYWSTSMAGPGALVTSKGYPTLATRWFLHHIHATAPRLPIYGLVDYDPHGIRIFRTYQCGSQSLRHEDNTTVPGMKWLGLQSCDLLKNFNSDSICLQSPVLENVLPLTAGDRKTAVSLLNEIHHSAAEHDDDASDLVQYREVQVMLMLSVKAEIQAADDHGDLAAWLDEKLYQAQEDVEE